MISEGKLEEAEKIYTDLIHKGVAKHTIYGNLAVVKMLTGNNTAAEQMLRKSLEINPEYAEAYHNMGIIKKSDGSTRDAIHYFQEAIRHQPLYPDAFNNLGIALQEEGQANQAIDSFKKAIELKPDHAEAHHNLGLAFLNQGDAASAIAYIDKSIALKLEKPQAFLNLGNALMKQERHEEAIHAFNTSLEILPNWPEAYACLGNAYYRLGDTDKSIDSYARALEANPDSAEVCNNIGLALQEAGAISSAESAFRKALGINPDMAEANNNMGNLYLQNENIDLAVEYYSRAVKANPSFHSAYYNSGNAYREKNSLAKAISLYRKALEIAPDSAEAHWNLALALLLDGNYEEGWKEYEWRSKGGRQKAHVIPDCIEWKGCMDNRQNELILVSEQGLGDTIQFIRYAQILKDKGLRLQICVQKKLHGLLQESGIDNNLLAPENLAASPTSTWSPLLSVPRHLGVSPSNPLITTAYLNTTEELVIKWKRLLSNERKPIIGIHWQGNPQAESTHLKGRSFPLELFSCIASNPNISLLSLQKGFGSDQLDKCSFKSHFVGCQSEITNTWCFLENAAIIANCDLVITSDSAIAHLSGALGQKTWLLLQKIPDWRWGLHAEKTFWYDSFRVYRQSIKGNWHQVFQRIAEDLKAIYG